MAKPKFTFGCPKTVVACIRVSGKEQELSPEAQLEALEQYCVKHGLTLAETFVEKITSVAPLEERLGLLDALKAIQTHNAGILLFYDRDRIARDVLLTKLIEREAIKAGAVVATVTGTNGTTPEDEAMKTVQDAFAQLELAKIRRRTKESLAAKKRRGEHLGNVPYGYQWWNGQIVPHPEEQEVIAKVRALAQAGMSAPKISQVLGPVNRRGNTFGKTQILKMLRQA